MKQKLAAADCFVWSEEQKFLEANTDFTNSTVETKNEINVCFLVGLDVHIKNCFEFSVSS